MDNEKRIFVLFTGYMCAGVRRRSAGDHFGMMQTVHHLRKWNELCFGHNYVVTVVRSYMTMPNAGCMRTSVKYVCAKAIPSKWNPLSMSTADDNELLCCAAA